MFDQKIIDRLKRFIALRIREKEDIEEILQETLISACQSWPSFKGRSSFFSWLGGIAKHEIADFYRKQKIKTIFFSHWPFLKDLADRALGPEEELLEEELKRRVKGVLAKLNEGYRLVLRLKYLEGNSVTHIAKRLDVSTKTIESRLSRARLAFRKIWQPFD